MPRPRILLLSTTTGYQLRSFDAAAERLGVDLVFATDRCHSLDDPWRDRALPIRFHDERPSLRAILHEAERSPFAGVIAVGDRPTVLAARAAVTLHLPGNSPDAAMASGNKREARARFASAGLPVPWHFTLPAHMIGAVAVDDPRLRFPCVLKPLGLSGSRGVIRADDPDSFVAAFNRICALLRRVDVRAARTGLEGTVLVEGFIPGLEYAVEGVLTGGDLQVFALFDKPDPLDGPFFEETIYRTPSTLDALAAARIVDAVSRATRALGLSHGPVHAECRVSGDVVAVLEVAARPIGGLCSRALHFQGGLTLEDVLLRHAQGESVARFRQDPEGSAVMMIPIPRRGLLKRVAGIDLARAVPNVEAVHITAKIDQLLEPLPEAGSYLGFIFARAARPEDAEAAVREAHRALTFVIQAEIGVIA